MIGQLRSGQEFYGVDAIRIIGKLEYVGVLAEHWLEVGCGEPGWCGGVDVDQSSMVDFVDLALFNSCCIAVVKE